MKLDLNLRQSRQSDLVFGGAAAFARIQKLATMNEWLTRDKKRDA
jgi:hypothetical protein